MNIRAIHTAFFHNFAQPGTCATKPNSINSKQNLPVLKLHSQPATDIVSFKRAPENCGSPFIHDPRELDLHCGCCNHRMIKNNTVQNFMDKTVYFPAYIALDRIKYEQNFRLKEQSPQMQRVYAFIKHEALRNKDKNMEELLRTEKVVSYQKRTSKAHSQALNELRNRCRAVTHDISYFVEEIDKLKPDFQKTEDTVFQDLKMFAKLYPTDTIANILNKPEIREYYLIKLQKKQNTKLRKIQPLIQQLSPQAAKRANNALDRSFMIFNKESCDILHKRQRVINLFENAFNQIPPEQTRDLAVAAVIRKRLEALPDSKNDSNAFIVKYAPRGSNSLVEVLIKRLRNTKEHVKPQHRKGDQGESDKKNYIYLCGKCNHERMTQKYDEFIEKHSQMPENTQKQIDEICDFINQGILDGYDTWPEDIKTPLGEESEGLIIINSDKLNLKQAKENRAAKLEKYIEEQKKAQAEDTLATGPYRRHGKKRNLV